MTPSDSTFVTSRRLPFAPEEVYQAFADPQRLAAWWGPRGFTNTFQRFSFTEGGRWSLVMHGPDGSNYPNENIFRELRPAERVVVRHDGPPYFTLTVTLRRAADGTVLSWEQAFDDPSTAQAVKAIVVPANEDNLDRLTAVLHQHHAG